MCNSKEQEQERLK